MTGQIENTEDVHHQIWYGDNHAVELESSKFILQKMNYIQNNLVAAGFVDDPAAWVYSSQRNYMGIPAVLEIDVMDN